MCTVRTMNENISLSIDCTNSSLWPQSHPVHRLIWPETLTTDLRQWMKTSSECKLYPYIVQIVHSDLSLINSSMDFIDLLVHYRVGGGHYNKYFTSFHTKMQNSAIKYECLKTFFTKKPWCHSSTVAYFSFVLILSLNES